MTKFAVLSDIHSNVFALDAVVNHAKSQGVTQFINLGDILYGPIAPKETYQYLLTLDAITISGNQDRQIYQATPEDIESNPTMAFILDELGQAPLEWMKQLPFDLQVTDDIYACHGTPTDDLVYLLDNVESGKPEVRADQEIIALLGDISFPMILCGHTHMPRCVELSTGQTVINPGSVGLQAYRDEEPVVHAMQNYSSQASYVILSKHVGGETKCGDEWDIAFHRVSYDVSQAIDAAQQRGRTDWVQYLRTGRC
ncbi:metallophosphoesterase [Vibrio gazogenes]|uniref:Predicted phosphodiesterase n=1 Tax=Vibrio gazogenes DSM 21264 = NBRC 103151 TaxID=1123492 RepID=A0A1M5EUS6_VIBGA|nr:metallophosphoesterase family protein [Vibrio gazogenes]USP14820.1 metallophosphatase family protein [Vibrio gazogenes]SHF82762.1 Predicted phosphodiesterase [Vibrio gazogenes DSM 21264] [Vibrio gazogenes DSM 21264 = NBRC 103151]SJN55221.1 phosphodiesterase [Vibrio gazogenes]